MKINGHMLAPVDVVRVAREAVPVELSQEETVRGGIDASYQLNRSWVEQGRPIYGTTTGVGLSVDRQIGSDRAAELQKNLVRLLGCGLGEPLPVDACRAALVARINCLARGRSAVSMELIERLIELLNRDAVPAIPERGSVGASGDLIPGSYIAAVVIGERSVYHDGAIQPTRRVFQKLGIEALQLQPKEALALVNGTNVMTGIAALALEDAERIARTADVASALATEVLLGFDGPFHSFLHEVAKPHPGQVRSAAHIRACLDESQLVRSFTREVEQIESLTHGTRELPLRFQDHYSIRCAPQCIGALYDAIEWIRDTVTRELNSSNDNPLYDAEAEAVHSGGNFAGFHIGLAMDTLKIAVASVADLIDRQFQLVNDDKYNNGLGVCCRHPLAEDHPDYGIHHGFKGVQLAVSALTAEALHLCTPMTVFSRSTACHNQDKVSMATTAARQAAVVVRLTEEVLAMHLLILAQAADLRGVGRLAPVTRSIYDQIRERSDYLQHDRELAGDIARVTELVRSGALTATRGQEDGA